MKKNFSTTKKYIFHPVSQPKICKKHCKYLIMNPLNKNGAF